MHHVDDLGGSPFFWLTLKISDSLLSRSTPTVSERPAPEVSPSPRPSLWALPSLPSPCGCITRALLMGSPLPAYKLPERVPHWLHPWDPGHAQRCSMNKGGVNNVPSQTPNSTCLLGRFLVWVSEAPKFNLPHPCDRSGGVSTAGWKESQDAGCLVSGKSINSILFPS